MSAAQKNKRPKRPPRSTRHRAKRKSRPSGYSGKKTQPESREAFDFQPRISNALAPVLKGIGVPETSPFVPDPFQTRSVELLEHSDVVVSAPTGSGKTWIAQKAIEKALASGQRAWYASPLKALSNAKYAEFGELFGPEQVGILTGDRKENASAPLIVGTTEILRNQLYDAMNKGYDLDVGLVVLDEAHYLGDEERGVVWEEVIIYLPVRVRLLLLSATVANAAQIARWLEFVRDEPARTVVSEDRPVPLFPIFLFPDGELTPLKKQGRLYPKVQHHLEKSRRQRYDNGLRGMPPVNKLLAAMDEANLLPAIFFLKSRADCDQAMSMVAGAGLPVSQEQRDALKLEVDSYLEKFPFLKSHPQLASLRKLHAAAHHAGHLPHWKILVERLMQLGLLKAIFSTSTVAAGVNFPARTVVITQSDRFNGREFADLRAIDLLQMTGRAGRRGMDNIGFCLVAPGPFNDIRLVSSLLDSEPESIRSQISINFSMALNLLLSHLPSEVKQLLGYSLATFQRLEEAGGSKAFLQGPMPSLRALVKVLDDSKCPGPEEAVVRRKRRRQLRRSQRTLLSQIKKLDQGKGADGVLTRGRVFMDAFGSLMAILRRERNNGEEGVLAVGLEPDRRLQKGKPRLIFVPLDEIAGCFQESINLPHAGGGKVLARAVLEQAPENPTPFSPSDLDRMNRQEKEKYQKRLERVERELEDYVCQDCPHRDRCLDRNSQLSGLLDQAEKRLAGLQQESQAFWYDFVHRLEFLRSENFVDAGGRLTPDGRWASKLRLDQPVLIAEAIRAGALPDSDPVLLAALVALFVDDREREGEGPYLSQRLKDGMAILSRALEPMLARLRQWGFETPPMSAAAAAAVFAWGLDSEFDDVVQIYGGAEGDLARVIYRTADNLRQIISLRDTHPRLAASAREANELLLKPPVVVPT